MNTNTIPKIVVEGAYFIPLVSVWKSYSMYLTRSSQPTILSPRHKTISCSPDIFQVPFTHALAIGRGHYALFTALFREIHNRL